MKIRHTVQAALGLATLLGASALSGLQAQAGTLYNGWNYSIDSFNDGTEGYTIGDKSKFEFYGMAYRQVRNKVYFAFNSNLSLDGYRQSNALNGKISYGDLFLNFANPASFKQANGKLQGIRFDATNDTQMGLGLYQNVTAKSLTTSNSGYGSLQQHTNTVNGSLKGNASYGDMAANTSYFDNSKAAATTIASGSLLGAIEKVADFSGLDLDFARFKAKGTYTFGFSVDKKLLPNGSFIASLFAECGNDGMVLSGDLKDVPEPSVMAGLIALGLLAAAGRLRRRAAEA